MCQLPVTCSSEDSVLSLSVDKMKSLLAPFWLLNCRYSPLNSTACDSHSSCCSQYGPAARLRCQPWPPKSRVCEHPKTMLFGGVEIPTSLSLCGGLCQEPGLSRGTGPALVNQRDTALRPATTILGEDIWYVINSITML